MSKKCSTRPCADVLEPRRLLAATPQLVGDLNTTSDFLYPERGVTAGSTVYFTGRTNAGDGLELWKTDGTRGGTVLVSEIRPGMLGSDPLLMTASDGRVFFTADDGVTGRELWVSDGTAAGTTRLKDIVPGPNPSNPTNLFAVGRTVYFSAPDGTGSARLWATNGLASETYMITGVANGGGTYNPRDFAAVPGGLVFSAAPSAGGTAALQRLDFASGVVSPVGGVAPTDPRSMVAFNGAVYFFGGPTGAGFGVTARGDLYRTDGTAAGTALVKRIDFDSTFDRTNISSVTVSGNRLFFLAGDANTGSYFLWRSDGTEAGTATVAGVAGFARNHFLTPTGANGVAFAYSTTAVGFELWFCGPTGTPAPLKDLTPGPGAGLDSFSAIRAGSTTYFTPGLTWGDGRVFKTDGTPAGTVQVGDFTDTPGFVYPIGAIGDVAIYVGGRYFGHGDLYRTDGTAAGTVRVGATAAANGSSMQEVLTSYGPSPAFVSAGRYVYFAASDGIHGRELWRADADGTDPVMVADLAPGGDDSEPTDYAVAADGTLYFTATTPNTGKEIFRLAPGGTPRLIGGDVAGPVGSDPRNLVAVGNVLYFAAKNQTTGQLRLRRHVQLSENTSSVGDVTGAGNAGYFHTPTALTRAGDRWYFGATGSTTALGAGLYHVDGGAYAVPVLAANAQTGGVGTSIAPLLGTADGSFYFSSQDAATGRELWRSTGSGASRVLDLSPGTASTSFYTAEWFAGALYVVANTEPVEVTSLLRVDPSTGTATTVAPGHTLGRPAVLGSSLYYVSSDAQGTGVFRTDAADPTGRTRVIEPGAGDTAFAPFTVFAAGPYVYAVGQGGTAGGGYHRQRMELWRTTGAVGSAERVAVVQPESMIVPPTFHGYWLYGRDALAASDTHLFFPMFTAARGFEPHALPLVDPPGTISGYVYDDANGDGAYQFQTERPIAGRTVFLDADDDGQLDAGETSQPTNANGWYQFAVPAGTYRVATVVPAGQVATGPTSLTRAVASGQAAPDAHFFTRLDPATPGRIAGFVFNDLDADGVRDGNESPLLPGATVYLDADDDAVLDPGERAFTTQLDGYWFDGVAPGTYKVRQQLPAGWRQTAPGGGDAAAQVVAVAPGQLVYNVDFGRTQVPTGPVVTTLRAAADAYVRDGASAATNFGAAGELNAGRASLGNNRVSYLRFDLTQYPVGQPIGSAKVRLSGNLSAPLAAGLNVGVYAVPNAPANWDELALRWPGLTGTAAAPLATARVTGTAAAWYEWDVTAYVNQQRALGRTNVTLAVKGTVLSAAAFATFASDEAADPARRPQLAARPPLPPVTLAAKGDAYVRDGAANLNSNFGQDPLLLVRRSTLGENRESHVAFDLSNVSSATSVKLRLYGGLASGTLPATGINVGLYGARSAAWSESTLTFRTRPLAGAAISTTALRITSATARWYEVDVTAFVRAELAAGRKQVAFVIRGLTTTTATVGFNSGENASNGPELVVAG